jgi:integrase
MNQGTITKRCSCVEPGTKRRLGAQCPLLRRTTGGWSPTHGTFHLQLELPTPHGQRRRQWRRGGYDTRTAAQADLDRARTLLALAAHDHAAGVQIGDLILGIKYGHPLPDPESVARRIKAGVAITATSTVGDYLDQWLAGHTIADTTRVIYTGHIRMYLKPHLGHLEMEQLRIRHVQDMFQAIIDRNTAILEARTSDDPAVRASVKGMRIVSAASRLRIRATLRKALNDAIADPGTRLIAFNPAAHLKMVPGKRPKARIWDTSAIKHWKATGSRPSPVMVWLPDQAGQFLDYAEGHDIALYPMFALILSRGLRRGEACGLRDMDVNLDDGTITIAQQLTTCGYQPVIKDVKSDAGERTVTLDPRTIQILRNCLVRRAKGRLVSGDMWPNTGLFFVQPGGQAWHPDTVGDRFRTLIQAAGLPPIRLHDARHCAASYLKLAGADIKTVQETLGHSSSVITSDTYTSIFQRLEQGVADDAANLIHRNRRRQAV